jgi:hypothetical protein
MTPSSQIPHSLVPSSTLHPSLWVPPHGPPCSDICRSHSAPYPPVQVVLHATLRCDNPDKPLQWILYAQDGGCIKTGCHLVLFDLSLDYQVFVEVGDMLALEKEWVTYQLVPYMHGTLSVPYTRASLSGFRRFTYLISRHFLPSSSFPLYADPTTHNQCSTKTVS